jgi:uncharacterized protein with HEPN domain
MFSEPDREGLEDIVDNIARVFRFLADLDLEDFLLDDKSFYAAMRCLEIVSEASRRLSPELKTRHSEIPWKDIAGSGSIYRHAYENVQAHRVWATVHDALPLLRVAAECPLPGALAFC